MDITFLIYRSSCPGDIKSELPLIEKAVSEFNTMFSDALGISIRTKHWSKNSYAQSGGKPQALLNEQFVRECDAAVALLWTRFGTPTDQYGSGTAEELQKHKLLTELYEKIIDFNDWQKVSDSFKGIPCVRLALSNTGTAIDEDVDITLRVPKSAFKALDELPEIQEDTMRYLTRDCDMDTLFGIQSTAEYNDYDSSLRPNAMPSVSSRGVSFGQPDYAEDYRNALEDIFCYDVYQNGSEYVISLKFDYIKHHTTTAFPAGMRFVKGLFRKRTR